MLWKGKRKEDINAAGFMCGSGAGETGQRSRALVNELFSRLYAEMEAIIGCGASSDSAANHSGAARVLHVLVDSDSDAEETVTETTGKPRSELAEPFPALTRSCFCVADAVVPDNFVACRRDEPRDSNVEVTLHALVQIENSKRYEDCVCVCVCIRWHCHFSQWLTKTPRLVLNRVSMLQSLSGLSCCASSYSSRST